MDTLINTYQHQDTKTLIWQSVARLDKFQQIKLLEFINSMFIDVKQETNALLKYAGCISESELRLMRTAIKDCEKIDHNEW